MNPGDVFNPHQYAKETNVWVQDIVGRWPYREMKDGPKRLYNQLARFAGKDGRCFPSQATLAKELGKCVRQVYRDLNVLEEMGLIQCVDGQRENSYVFLWHERFDNPPGQSARGVSGRTPLSSQEGNKSSSARTGLSSQRSSDRTELASCSDMIGAVVGQRCPPNPLNPVEPSSSSEDTATVVSLLRNASGLRFSEEDATEMLERAGGLTPLRDWLDGLVREGRNSRLRAINGYKVDLARWAATRTAQAKQGTQYEEYRGPQIACRKCNDGGVRNDGEYRYSWCDCAMAGRIRAEKGDGYPAEMEASMRSILESFGGAKHELR